LQEVQVVVVRGTDVGDTVAVADDFGDRLQAGQPGRGIIGRPVRGGGQRNQTA
jgi:hypothetical protein